MDIDKRQGDTAGTYGTVALVIGFLITGVGLITDSIPAKGFFFAGLLVFTGAALRLEQAITERRDSAGPELAHKDTRPPAA